MKKNTFLTLLLISAILGFIVRLYRIDNPIADWHAWRQADTSAVSKRLIETNFDVFHPKYFDISNVQSGKDNPHGYRMVEFPLFNVLQAGMYTLFPFWSLELWGRLVIAAIYVVSGVFFALFTSKHFGKITGFFLLIYYLFMPYAVYYSRTILPDPFMISLSVIGLYCFDKYLEGKKKIVWFLAAFAMIAGSFLAKPYAAFYIPIYIVLAYQKMKLGLLKRVDLYILGIAASIPLILWRYWISQFPEGIPSSSWLLNAGDIRFKGAFFYWIFGERIGKLILGYFGTSLFVLGLLIHGKKNLLLYAFVLSSALYVTIFARGNVQHDYYQIFLIPTISLLLARGAAFIIENQKKQIGFIFVGLVTLISFALSWYYVRDYFNINNIALVHAGQRADEILPHDAKVIAPFDGDTSLLYYINRPGWPSFQKSIEELIQNGATSLVIVNPNENDFQGFGKNYKIMDSSREYLILDLRK